MLGALIAICGGPARAAGFFPVHSPPIPRFGPAPERPSAPTVEHHRSALFGADPRGGWQIDTARREEVRLFYLAVQGASVEADPSWAGNVTQCLPGSNPPAFQTRMAWRINYHRAMAGVPADIRISETLHPRAMAASLIMTANGWLDHFPPATARCWSQAGYDAASTGNLALGVMGPEAIDGYMLDHGANNFAVPHRRWLLHPVTRIMATGDIPETPAGWAANTTIVFDEHHWDPRPPTRDGYVAWPPPGYTPHPIMPVRWSFSHPDAGFDSATVVVRFGDSVVPTEIESVADPYGEPALVWKVDGLDADRPHPWPRPAQDTAYTVTLDGVSVAGRSQSWSYTVRVFDPDTPGPDSVLPELTGPANPPAGATTTYHFDPPPNATGFDWLTGRPVAAVDIEGADVDTGSFDPQISPGYSVRSPRPEAPGQMSFHLAHPLPADQFLTHRERLLPGTGARLRFSSRLSFATPTQIARVQVSTDDGRTWRTVDEQPGTDEGDRAFHPREIPLDAFAGRLIRFRFNYHHAGGPYYPQTDADPQTGWVGWFIDDIQLVGLDRLDSVQIGRGAEPGRFDFTPAAPGDHAVAVRGRLFDEFPLEWGPARRLAVTDPIPFLVRLETVSRVEDGTLRMVVVLDPPATSPTIVVWRAEAPDGPWSMVTNAVIEPLDPGRRLQLQVPAPEPAGFFRVTVTW